MLRQTAIGFVFVCTSALLLGATASAEPIDAVRQLQKEWAQASYEVQKADQPEAFERLIEQSVSFSAQYPDSAEVLIWEGVIRASYAGANGGLGALSQVKQAKKVLERAIGLDPTSLSGSAYVTLGSLYHQVPGWPIAFGSDDRARQYLLKGLELNPRGIDPNYFYAEFLIGRDEHGEARQVLLRALDAPARPDRPLADRGRREQVAQLMDQVERELRD